LRRLDLRAALRCLVVRRSGGLCVRVHVYGCVCACVCVCACIVVWSVC